MNTAPTMDDPIMQMQQNWDPNHPLSLFRHYFYNLVHPTEVPLYSSTTTQDPLLEQARRDNPDPTCMVPVLALGFADLKKRISIQTEQHTLHQQKLTEISQHIDAMLDTHNSSTLAKLKEVKRRQRVLIHQILKLMISVQVVRNQGYSLHPDEEIMASKLESMKRDLERPAVFRGRLNEIWASLLQLSSLTSNSSALGGSAVEISSDADSLKPVIKALQEMQIGLKHLTEITQQDNEMITTLKECYSQSTK